MNINWRETSNFLQNSAEIKFIFYLDFLKMNINYAKGKIYIIHN